MPKSWIEVQRGSPATPHLKYTPGSFLVFTHFEGTHLRVQPCNRHGWLTLIMATPPFALVRARDACVYTWTPFRPGEGTSRPRPLHVPPPRP